MNLSEIVVRAKDTLETLLEKVELATILGTFQSTLTNFPYLRKIWQKNTEEERLLGVSLTGIMDNRLTNGAVMSGLPTLLTALKERAIDVNRTLAADIGINPSTAITCVKPSGTVSQLVNSASGIHSRHSEYYIRSVRGDNKDSLTRFLIDSGVPNEPELSKPTQTTVFYFPIRAPEGAVTRDQETALKQLELWKMYQLWWCEHKPSITVSVREHEWPEVGAWVYNNFDMVSGISFLPYDGGTYKQPPYEQVTLERLEELEARMPKEIRWEDLNHYEQEDNTTGVQSLACSADGCEIVDI